MKGKISAIIIDRNKDSHKYNDLSTNYFDGIYDETFDIKVYKTTNEWLTVLNNNRGFDCLITIGNDIDFKPLNNMSFEYRKKWVHLEEYNRDLIINTIVGVFKYNINRTNGDQQLFSMFTSAYNTPIHMVKRLYNSLCAQTYNNWNWWIIDDSSSNKVNYFERLNDPRIHIIKNVTEHGNIGFNKHLIAMIADGDYLVEVDHDDELTPDCLELLKKAFDTYPDCDFAYSYAFEEIGGNSVYYGDDFALGLGEYEEHEILGKNFVIPTTPDVNALSIRHIVAEPNHVRCWKKEFYHKIGGHNTELSVLDDMDILIRTFLNGKMCKIPKVLYIQHEGEDRGDRSIGDTTQSKRFAEIQRLGCILREKYDKEIHDYLIKNNIPDPYWVDNGDYQYAAINLGPLDNTINLNYTLEI